MSDFEESDSDEGDGDDDDDSDFRTEEDQEMEDIEPSDDNDSGSAADISPSMATTVDEKQCGITSGATKRTAVAMVKSKCKK